jgi:hypothetical protein
MMAVAARKENFFWAERDGGNKTQGLGNDVRRQEEIRAEKKRR